MWLGHHSPAFTLATYVHLLPDDSADPTCFEHFSPWAEGSRTTGARQPRSSTRISSAK